MTHQYNALKDFLRKRNISLNEGELKKLINICSTLKEEQNQEEQEDAIRNALDEGEGCSRCQDLSGFECICDYEDDDESFTGVFI